MKKILKFLGSCLKIGCIGFGGGTSLIPVMEEEMVHNQKMVTKDTFDDAVLIASITPGALPVEISGSLGRALWGRMGMLLAAVCMAFPGVLFTILFLSGMDFMPKTALWQIEIISIGITAFILYMLVKYIASTVRWAKEKNRKGLAIGIILGVFVLQKGFHISSVLILLLAFIGLLGVNILRNSFRGVRKIQNISYVRYTCLKEEVVWFGFLVICSIPALLIFPDALGYLVKGIWSSLLSFGGGDAYLTVADSLFVESNMISAEEFYGHLVTIANILPGSILCKILAGIGYYIGYDYGGLWTGLAVALAGFACSVFASGAVVSLAQWLVDNFGDMPVLRMLKSWIKAIVSGLLGSVILSLLGQCCKIGVRGGCSEWFIVAQIAFLFFLNGIMDHKLGMRTWSCVLVSGILACVIGNIIM